MRPDPPVLADDARAGWRRRLSRPHLSVLVAFVSLGAVAGSWGSRIPDIKASLELGEGALGTALLVLSIGAVSGAWLGGLAVRRWGSRTVVRTGWVSLGLVVPLAGWAVTWGQLAGALAVQGVAIGVLDVSMNGAGVQLEASERRPLMNGLHGGWSGGVLLGAATGAVAVVTGLDPGVHLSVAGAVIVVSGLALGGSTPDGVIGPGSSPLAEVGGDGAGPGGRSARASARAANRRLAALAAIGGFLFLAEGALLDWAGVLVRETLDGGQVLGVLAVNGVALGGLLGRLAGDRLTARFGPAPLIRAGALLAAVSLAVVLALPAAAPAPLLILAAGAGMGPAVPLAFAAAGRLRGASGIALVTTAGYGCYLAGPAVIGWLAEQWGLRISLLVPVSLVASVALLAWSTADAPAGDVEPHPEPV